MYRLSLTAGLSRTVVSKNSHFYWISVDILADGCIIHVSSLSHLLKETKMSINPRENITEQLEIDSDAREEYQDFLDECDDLIDYEDLDDSGWQDDGMWDEC